MRNTSMITGTVLAAFLVLGPAMAQDDGSDSGEAEVAQEVGVDAVLQELQSAVDQVQTLLAESRAEYEAAIAERDETIESLEAGLAGHSEALAAAEARISELDAALVEAQSRAEAAEQSAAALSEDEQAQADFLESLQNQLLEERAQVQELDAQLASLNEALDVGLADAETMRTALEEANAERETMSTELAQQQTALQDSQAAVGAGEQSVRLLTQERDSLKTQRFWLSILVALSLAGLGFLWLQRPRKDA